MNRDEHRRLLAERGALERILAGIPREDVLDRGSFLARLEQVEHSLAAVTADRRNPARARLTYRGRPVVDNYGIFADFGMSATKAFTDAVSRMAAGLVAPLASSGPIPNRDQHQLLITSTAVGSFGFELEELLGDQLSFDEETPVALALAQTQELLRGTLGTDDELADAATGADPRAVAAVRAFLTELMTNEAVCALEFSDHRLIFSDVGQVRRSFERLGQDNLREDEEHFEGAFQGVLPRRRTFEFQLADSEAIITGKLGPGIVDPGVLNQHLQQPAQIQVQTVRVGNGRPRFVLNEPPEWRSQAGTGRH